MILGVIVSALELPCTGGIYIAVLGLLANQATLTQGYIYLLIYNLIFVMPLIFILFITYFSLTSETINSWRKKNKRVMRLIMGLVMITLGIIMILLKKFPIV